MRGIERPPGWASAVLAVLVLVNLGVVGYLFLGSDEPAAAGTAARVSGTTAATASPASTAAASPVPASPSTSAPSDSETPVTLVVYGDGYSAGNEVGGRADAGWPARVAAATGTELRLAAVPQAGYASAGVDGRSFLDLVTGEDAPASVTVVFGSRNDLGHEPADVRAGAEATFGAIEDADPGTVLMVIGPAWSDGWPPEQLTAIGDEVAAAAQEAGAVYVDPLAEGWFAEPAGRIGPDGVSPTDGGHAYLAGLIGPTVAEAVARAGSAD
jgi:hypothetical protein